MPTPVSMRSLPLFLMIALSFHVHGQWSEWADQRSEEVRLQQALPVGGGRWAVIGDAAFAGSHMVSVRNADGTIAWEDVAPYFIGEFGDVVLMPDSGLLRVGAFDGCDYIDGESRVRRSAADGAVLWERIFASASGATITMAAKGSLDRLAVASSDSVHLMDMDGNLIGGFPSPQPDIKKILWAGDTALFMVSDLTLYLMDVDGSVLASTPIGTPISDLHWGGGQLFVLNDEGVRRFDADLEPLGATALAGLAVGSKFVVSGGGLYVNTTTGLEQLEGDGTATFLFSWPALPELVTAGCAVRNGTVFAVGNTNISGRSTGIIRTLSLNGQAIQHDQDVEVLLQVDSAWAEYVGGWYPWNRRADITGLVVNHGTDTLHSVVLSMWVQVPWILCDQFANRIDTAGLALPPGDTLSLPFGAVDVAMGLAQSQVDNVAGEICIVALAPDRLADRAPDDNTACGTYDFTLGISDRMQEVQLSLAPNPVVNTGLLSGLAAIGAPVHIRIMDLTGRIVSERSSTVRADALELDLSGLPSATYILNVQGERSSAMLKLIVTRP